MLSTTRYFQIVSVVMTATLLLTSSCGTDPPPGPVGTDGTIVIDQTPDALEEAPWSLTGPQNETGSGDSRLTGMPVGEYTLTWGGLIGYLTPSTITQTVAAGRTIAFNGYFDTCGFVLINPGSFQMGSAADELNRLSNETRHSVTLTQGFYMSTCEVTQKLWDDVMGSGSSTSQLPKNYVSWDDAVAFCNALSISEGLTPAYTINGTIGDVIWDRAGNGYRLPTEAEWEFACRAGATTTFANGAITDPNCIDSVLGLIGWYCGNADDTIHAVGQLVPNNWGLYDMHGNLFEWCWDGYRDDYENLMQQDPAHDVGPFNYRVLRGGLWLNSAGYCRSARRFSHYPSFSASGFGFRPVRSIP